VGGNKIVLSAPRSREIEDQIKTTHAIPHIASKNLDRFLQCKPS
jgi:hypothetical protein